MFQCSELGLPFPHLLERHHVLGHLCGKLVVHPNIDQGPGLCLHHCIELLILLRSVQQGFTVDKSLVVCLEKLRDGWDLV